MSDLDGLYLLIHVPVSLLVLLHLLPFSDGSRGAQDGNLVQLEELLTQAVLQVLVQLAAGGECVGNVGSQGNNRPHNDEGFQLLPSKMFNFQNVSNQRSLREVI